MKVALAVLLATIHALTPRELYTKLVLAFKQDPLGWKQVVEAYHSGEVKAFEPCGRFSGEAFGANPALKVQQVVEFFLAAAPKEQSLPKPLQMKDQRGKLVDLRPEDLLPQFGGVKGPSPQQAKARKVLEEFMLGCEATYGLNLYEDEESTVYESGKRGLLRMATSTADELIGREKNIDALALWVEAFAGEFPTTDDVVSVRTTLQRALRDLDDLRQQVKESLGLVKPLLGKAELTAGELALKEAGGALLKKPGNSHFNPGAVFYNTNAQSPKEIVDVLYAAKADLDSAVAYIKANLRELEDHRKGGHVYTHKGEALFSLPCVGFDPQDPTASAMEDW